MIKGLTNTVRPTEDSRTAVSWEQLKLLVALCNKELALMPHKVGLIFGFLGYMRLPNLAPQTAGEFDQSRHTSWNDIVLLKEGIVVKIK